MRAKETQDGSEQQAEDQPSQISLFTDRKRAKAKYVSKLKQGGLTREQLIELERQKHSQTQEWYQELKDAEVAMRAGVEEAIERWLLFAEKLVEMFRETRKLFPARTVSNSDLSLTSTLMFCYNFVEQNLQWLVQKIKTKASFEPI